MFKFTVNVADFEKIFNQAEQELRKNLSKWVKQATNILHTEVNKLTPEQTWTLKKWNKQEFSSTNKQVVWTITNKVDYAIYVEEWVWWKTYNYHKKKKVIHRWKWNKGYERSIENKEKEIYETINKSITL